MLNETWWRAFSEDTDECCDEDINNSCYAQYVKSFVEFVPDADDLINVREFWKRIGGIVGTETAIDLGLQKYMTSVNMYATTLSRWIDILGPGISRDRWRSILHNLFLFYDDKTVLTNFLKHEKFPNILQLTTADDDSSLSGSSISLDEAVATTSDTSSRCYIM